MVFDVSGVKRSRKQSSGWHWITPCMLQLVCVPPLCKINFTHFSIWFLQFAVALGFRDIQIQRLFFLRPNWKRFFVYMCLCWESFACNSYVVEFILCSAATNQPLSNLFWNTSSFMFSCLLHFTRGRLNGFFTGAYLSSKSTLPPRKKTGERAQKSGRTDVDDSFHAQFPRHLSALWEWRFAGASCGSKSVWEVWRCELPRSWVWTAR